MTRLRARKALSIAAMSILLVSCGEEDESAVENADTSGATALEATETDSTNAAGDNTAPRDASAGAPASLEAAVAGVEADILGVRLGMTPHEAEAALKENKPDNVRLSPRSYASVDPAHSSGIPPVKADTPGAFVPFMSARGPGSTHDIQIAFANPPAENLVESIVRKQLYSSVGDQQTSLDVYRQSLIDKYGPPAEEDKSGAILLLKWLYPSSASDCTPLKSNLPATKQGSSYPDDMGHPPETCANRALP